MVSLCGRLIGYSLILFNLICLVEGLFLVYLGVRTLIFNSDYDLKTLFESYLKSGAISVIVFGVLVVIISLIGCIGAIRHNICFLQTYASVVFCAMLCSVALLSVIVAFHNTIHKKLETFVHSGIVHFSYNQQQAMTLQTIQHVLNCCGWNGVEDYQNFDSINKQRKQQQQQQQKRRELKELYAKEIPASCCEHRVSSQNPQKLCPLTELSLETGCKHSPVIALFLHTLIALYALLILMQIVIVLAVCCFIRDIKYDLVKAENAKLMALVTTPSNTPSNTPTTDQQQPQQQASVITSGDTPTITY